MKPVRNKRGCSTSAVSGAFPAAEKGTILTKTKSPRVSVGIPVYNGSDYISGSIESVLAQTYRDFELVVCDNCSTDNTEEIVRGFDDPRIRYIRNQKNLGLVGNANRFLELAEGEYAGILHHDDLMMPDNLEQKVRLLDEHPEVGFVHSNIMLIDPKGEVISQNIWNEEARHDYFEDGKRVFQRFLSYIHIGASIFIGSVLARRECYQRLGGFSTALPHCNDSEMWMRMALYYNVACIGTPLVQYRVHPSSTSNSWGDFTSLPYLKEHYQAVKMIFEKYGERIPHISKLKQQVSRDFGKRAVSLACRDLSDGNFQSGREYFREALKMHPAIYENILFWKAAARLAVGPAGLKFYRFFR